MTKHRVDIDASAPSMRASRAVNGRAASDDDATSGVAGVVGIEHKPRLSEAVLRAVGMHGGVVPATDADDAHDETRASNDRARALHKASSSKSKRVVRDLRDSDGAIFVVPPESADDCSNGADVVNYLQHKYEGYFERTPIETDDGEIVNVKLTYGASADVVTGLGATTKSALRALAAKLHERFACLGDDDEAQEADNV